MACRIPPDAYLLIIGAMKCGTSSLFDYLQGHPEICPATVKEPEYFSEKQDHGLAVTDYGELWDFDPDLHKFVLDASTGYTKYPLESNVPARIHRYGIKPKFIYIVRNPIDRVASHINYIKHDAFDSEAAISTSKYFMQLEQFRAYFPREDFLILDFDELKEDSRSLLCRIYSFLGLTEEYFPDEFHAIKPHFESSFEKRLKQFKNTTFLNRLPKPFTKAVQEMIISISSGRKRVLNDEEKAFLYKELQDDMRCLQKTYGIDVMKWGFDV